MLGVLRTISIVVLKHASVSELCLHGCDVLSLLILSLPHYHNLPVALVLSLSQHLSASLCVSLSLCGSVSLSLSISRSLFCISPLLCLSLPLSLSLYLSPFFCSSFAASLLFFHTLIIVLCVLFLFLSPAPSCFLSFRLLSPTLSHSLALVSLFIIHVYTSLFHAPALYLSCSHSISCIRSSMSSSISLSFSLVRYLYISLYRSLVRYLCLHLSLYLSISLCIHLSLYISPYTVLISSISRLQVKGRVAGQVDRHPSAKKVSLGNQRKHMPSAPRLGVRMYD